MNNITDSIKLPNDGIVYLDSKAYDTLDNQSYSYDKQRGKWTYTITFTNDTVVNNKKSKLELR